MSAMAAGHDFGGQKLDLKQGSRTLTNVAFFRWGYREVMLNKEMVFSTFFLPTMGSPRQKFSVHQKLSAFNFRH
jgi:hypothetical protein